MIAFDTDVLTGILVGRPGFAERASKVAVDQQGVPIIVIEEIMRGRLNVIRQAEAGRSKITIDRAYELFERNFRDFQRIQILGYSAEADTVYQSWRKQRIRVSTHDLRIAATAVVHEARLISGNRRDFERVPGLDVEFWE
jgi:tRNA(fMet)-specific endonuclease VapC